MMTAILFKLQTLNFPLSCPKAAPWEKDMGLCIQTFYSLEDAGNRHLIEELLS